MKTKYIMKTIFIIAIIIIVFPYIKVEIHTYMYADEFKNIINENSMLKDYSYYKVMKYKKHSAEVVCVAKEHSACFLIYYEKKENNWYLADWKCIWSKSGTADGFIWSFYP